MTGIPPGPDWWCSCSNALFHDVHLCCACICVCAFVWVGKYEVDSLSLHVWRPNGIIRSRDTDKGKYCFLLRVQVGAGTHFTPLNIFTVISVYLCICEETEGDKNTRLPIYPIHHPPPHRHTSWRILWHHLLATSINSCMTSWVILIQGHGWLAVESCLFLNTVHQLFYKLHNFRPFHQRMFFTD